MGALIYTRHGWPNGPGVDWWEAGWGSWSSWPGLPFVIGSPRLLIYIYIIFIIIIIIVDLSNSFLTNR